MSRETYIVDKITQTTKSQDKKVDLLDQTSLAWLIVHMKILLQFRHHIDDLRFGGEMDDE